MTTLEKIRAEITELFKASGISNSSLCFAVLQIIDKYAEQEPCEEISERNLKMWQDIFEEEKRRTNESEG